ncbi:ferritin-like domain-containing protein, partial [Klebsiella pneumoniae]
MTTIAQACAGVLRESYPLAKVQAARAVARGWRRGALAHEFDVAMPDAPGRPDRP